MLMVESHTLCLHAAGAAHSDTYMFNSSITGLYLMQVAIALSLLVAEVTVPPFNETVCTFSARPQLHTVKGDALVSRVCSQACMFLMGMLTIMLACSQHARSVHLLPDCNICMFEHASVMLS